MEPVRQKALSLALQVRLDKGENSADRLETLLNVGLTEEESLHCLTSFLEHEVQLMSDIEAVVERWKNKRIDSYGALELIQNVFKNPEIPE